jgi:hypothetical protein
MCLGTLVGCGENLAGSTASSGFANYQEAIAPRAGAASVATGFSAGTDASTAIDTAAIPVVPAVAPEAIADAAIPSVAGTYHGSIQFRRSGVVVAKGPAVIRIFQDEQHEGQISGGFRYDIAPPQRYPTTLPIQGTVAPTARGAVLHFTFPFGAQQPMGGWATLQGGLLTGRGWDDPVQGEPYTQILFWAKQVCQGQPTASPTTCD